MPRQQTMCVCVLERECVYVCVYGICVCGLHSHVQKKRKYLRSPDAMVDSSQTQTKIAWK